MIRAVRMATLATLWLVPILIFALALTSDWVTTWRPLRVPFPISKFVDLYTVPSGIETLHNGGDPLVANPTELLHRPMNYPRVWLYLFSAAGITRRNTSTVALLFCAFYLACMSALIMRTDRALDAVILLLASLSIAPLHGMERGNTDLFVFSLVFLACMVTNKYLKSGLFGAAGLLKIFPIAAMVVDATRRPRKERVLAALATGLVILLVLLQWHDLILIRRGTPIGSFMSYGVLSLEQELLKATFPREFLIGLGWTVVVECWLAAALAIVTAWRNPRELDISIRNSRFVEMFCVFAGTYVFTYAISGNWAYRLIFLLPTLPLALELVRSSRHRLWGIAYIALLGLAENSIGFEPFGGTVDGHAAPFTIAGHAATFTLFIMLVGMLTRLLMPSLKGRECLIKDGCDPSPVVHAPQVFTHSTS